MYDELIEELRQHHCDAKEDDTQEVCEECAYDVIIADKSAPSGIASICVCGLMNRAADAIEELQKQRDEWESHAALAESFARGWIPVTERLPEKYIEVLVFAEGKIEGFFGDTVIAISKRYDFRIFTGSEVVEMWQSPWQYFLTDYEITHWMPLPEKPEVM